MYATFQMSIRLPKYLSSLRNVGMAFLIMPVSKWLLMYILHY